MMPRTKQLGLTLVEILVATILLLVLLAPGMRALHTGFVGADVHAEHSGNHYRLVARMETVLADPYASLEAAESGPSTPSSYSDAAGPRDRMLVFVAAYDADNADGDSNPFSGTDVDVLWVRVAIEGSVQDLASIATR